MRSTPATDTARQMPRERVRGNEGERERGGRERESGSECEREREGVKERVSARERERE